ncbi:capsule biosynthesis protein CapD [Paramagnetospirillum kuznetsovii]|uniref:Capsule biosynthesis protein CapD n=1 Tax=Paramagnetospirillum kuznetsovii TaxID=2053833 RepID=A0A364NY52_9PROT|nr:polysaccharide biosynthesis protein [Paramagnetospirillum kuznetsovii]RAU21835.1 capsule biosynthesis protein CapD [Paramagnetospirillum kuznetsovii]
MEQTFFNNSRIAITGAAGTVGKCLAKTLLKLPIAELRALDNNESSLFLEGERYRCEPRYSPFLCDVRDPDHMRRMLVDIDFVFHAAAFKHVPLCERSPSQAVQTNINGVQNLINAAVDNSVRRVIFTSSDKAVNPTNVMGTSKLMGERLITSANTLTKGPNRTIFSSTRFGNVAGSQGSVIPLFTQQIANGGPVTLTDERMTRFVMTLDEAVSVLIRSMMMACGGEVFVTKMPVIRISDLAEEMCAMLAPHFGHAPTTIQIERVGVRVGEKLFEELLNGEESGRAYDIDDGFFVILPAFRTMIEAVPYGYLGDTSRPVSDTYVSESQPFLTRQELRTFLMQPGVFEDGLRNSLT